MNPGSTSGTALLHGIRWVGFDMDECLGSFMPLWAYVDFLMKKLPKDKHESFQLDIAKRISDVNGVRTWLFRPELDKLLIKLEQAYKERKIIGCFILSNNASERLVNTVRMALNYRIERLTGNRDAFFHVGWHRTAKCRGGKETKEFKGIQACLRSAHLPPLNDPDDLLFFDDLEHVLKKEIFHYVQVPPYYHVTPHKRVFEILQSIFTSYGISSETLKEVTDLADKMEADDLRTDREISLDPPTEKSRSEMSVFLEGLDRFLENRKPNVRNNNSIHNLIKSNKLGGRRVRKTRRFSKSHVGIRRRRFNTRKMKKSIWKKY